MVTGVLDRMLRKWYVAGRSVLTPKNRFLRSGQPLLNSPAKAFTSITSDNDHAGHRQASLTTTRPYTRLHYWLGPQH